MCVHRLLNINPNACTVRFESQSGPLLNLRRFSQIVPASRHVWRHSVSHTYAFIRRWHWHNGCMLQNAKVNCSNSLIWGKHLRRIPNSSGSYNPSTWFDGKRPKDTIAHVNSIQLVMWFHIVPTRANISAAWPTLGKQWGSRVWNSIPWLWIMNSIVKNKPVGENVWHIYWNKKPRYSHTCQWDRLLTWLHYGVHHWYIEWSCLQSCQWRSRSHINGWPIARPGHVYTRFWKSMVHACWIVPPKF